MFYTYIYVDPRTGVPFYVGKGKDGRYKNTRKRNRCVLGRIRILEALGLQPLIIIEEREDEDDAFLQETFLIEIYGRKDRDWGPLFNHTSGGEGPTGCRRSPETRARISAARVGMIFGPMSEERKAKISLGNLGNKNAVGNHKPKTPQHRAKIGAANRGKKLSPETRAKMSVAHKARWLRAALMGNRNRSGHKENPP